jgi:hypothetical protein
MYFEPTIKNKLKPKINGVKISGVRSYFSLINKTSYTLGGG